MRAKPIGQKPLKAELVLAKVVEDFEKNGDGKLSMEEVKEGYLALYLLCFSDGEI